MFFRDPSDARTQGVIPALPALPRLEPMCPHGGLAPFVCDCSLGQCGQSGQPSLERAAALFLVTLPTLQKAQEHRAVKRRVRQGARQAEHEEVTAWVENTERGKSRSDIKRKRKGERREKERERDLQVTLTEELEELLSEDSSCSESLSFLLCARESGRE